MTLAAGRGYRARGGAQPILCRNCSVYVPLYGGIPSGGCMLATKTRAGRFLTGLVRVNVGLAAACIAALVVRFGVITHALEWNSTELQTEPETAPASGALCATFNERFYFDQLSASFDERFASAFGSSGNAAGKVARVEEDDNDMFLQPDNWPVTAPNPATASRHAGIREEQLNTAEAPMSLRLPLASDSHTAIYDIAARTVYLPGGHRLEAHSGLGNRLDDPRFIRAKMQGPTPPNVYNLTLRERLFHGVRAIRLVPIDDGKMFGRDGILAHSYMLGPNGQSNGCVSFRNYPAFLNAFLKGEVNRLVVVERLATATAKAGSASGG